MKVRTIRKHQNSHGDSFVKNTGKIYDAPDQDAEALIRRGLVEAADGPEGKDRGVSRAGAGTGGAAKVDG